MSRVGQYVASSRGVQICNADDETERDEMRDTDAMRDA